jgi:acyl carrier protein/tetratricopeptide (TPR) repeat protein
VDVYLARHETAGALRAVLRVLERCQEQNDRKTATLAQDAMVHVRLARNELAEAAAACDEAWAGVQNDSRDKEVTALVMETWAKVIYRCAGDAGETFRTYKEAARIAEEAGNVAMQVSCYHGAWQHCMLIRDPGGAKEVAGSLRDVCRKCQWSIGDATGKLCFARAFALTGAWDNAFSEVKSAEATAVRSGSRAFEAAVYRDVAEIHESKGDIQEAVEAYRKAQMRFKDAALCNSEAAVGTRLAKLFVPQEPMQAFIAAAEAQELCKKALNPLSELNAVLVMLQAATYVSADPSSKASRDHIVDLASKAVKDAGRLSQKFGDRPSEGAVKYYHAQLALAQGRAPAREALSIANDAVVIFEELEDLASQGHVKLLIAQIYNLWGREYVRKAIETARDAFTCFSSCGNEEGCNEAIDYMQNLGVNLMGLGLDAPVTGAVKKPVPQLVQDRSSQEVLEISTKVALTHADVLKRIRPIFAATLTDDTDISDDTHFMDLGMDSLNAVAFRNDVARNMDITLPATVTYDFPSLSAMADHIVAQL